MARLALLGVALLLGVGLLTVWLGSGSDRAGAVRSPGETVALEQREPARLESERAAAPVQGTRVEDEPIAAAERDALSVEEPLSGQVHWRFVDCEQREIPGITLVLGDQRRTTDAHGVVVFDVPEPPLRLPPPSEVEFESMPAELMPPWWTLQPNIRWAERWLFPEPGGLALDVVLAPRNIVRGKARHRSGEPIAAKHLSFRWLPPGTVVPAGPRYAVPTEEDGSFDVPNVEPGLYEVWPFAEIPGQDVRPEPLTVRIACSADPDELDLVFVPGVGAGVLQVTVKATDGVPVPEQTFWIKRLPQGASRKDVALLFPIASRQTGPHGTFTLHGLPWGDYLTGRVPSPAPSRGRRYLSTDDMRRFRVDPGQSRVSLAWELEIAPSASLAGTVLATDDPHYIVDLTVERPDGSTLHAPHESPQAGGDFLFEGVPLGVATVRLRSYSGKILDSLTLTLEDGETASVTLGP